MKKNVVRILTAVLMLSVVFSSSVFAAEKQQSAWDSFVGFVTGNAVTVADTQVDGVTYRTHIQNDGWAQGWVSDGDMSGSEGRGLRLEGIEIKIDGDTLPDGLGITYRTHIENDGWAQGWVEDGEMSGSSGRGLRLEAIEIKLTGDNADDYTVLYRTHIQNDGWAQGWVADGELSGSEGRGLRLEGIEIKIEQKTADLTEYEAALADVTQADYTAASWTAYQAVVNANVVDEDNLQSEVDAATAAISAAQANLVLVPKVTSVSVPNAKQLVVTFNKAMDKTTLLAGTTTSTTTDDYVLTAIAITPLDGQVSPQIGSITGTAVLPGALGVLSADGKTLTITLGGALNVEYLAGHYAVTVNTTVKDAAQIALPAKYTTNINVADTARPTFVGTTYTNFQTPVLAFSEPLKTTGTISYKLADGSALAVQPAAASLNADGKIVLNLTAVTDLNKDIVVTIIGATDYAGNVISPNPITATVIKNTTDTTKPEVSTVTVTSGTTFDIKFSEALIINPTIANIGANTVSVVVDATDATVYHATVSAAVTGLQTISVTAFSDLSNNAGVTPANKVANFSADTTKPAIVSSKVEKINGIEYLVLNYNKSVNTVNGAVITGSYVDNYVTTPMAAITTAAGNFTLYNPVDGKSNSVKLDLSSLTVATEYTVALPVNLVVDLFSNQSEAVTSLKFTRTSNSSTIAPKLDTTYGTSGVLVSGADNNTLNVQFDVPVAGATAVNLANYTVEGAVVESAVLTTNSPKANVKLTLVKDSNTLTGIRNLTVSGVTSQTGDVMTTANVAVPLNENVRPTVTKAELTTATPATSIITLTFSEDIKAASYAAGSFDVYVGGNKVTTGATTAAVAPTPSKSATITLTTPLTATDLAAGVVVKPSSTIAVTDNATIGNPLNFTSITVQ